jgi:flavin reductase (DIM6/NTAB) family NADH-FMN oxidoreductase RutF
MRQTIPELEARRLLGGGPVVLVTTAWRGNYNVMPATFVTPISFDPPLIGLAVHPERHTHDMIKRSEEFALSVPGRDLIHHCQYLGSVSGRDVDKFELSKLPAFKARKVDAPLVEGCVGYIECGLEDAYTMGDHTLFVGMVVAAQAEREAFEHVWLLGDDDRKPLHHIGANCYAILGGRLEARVPEAEGEFEETLEETEEEERTLTEGGEGDES